MADNIFRKYLWLISTIRTFGPITYDDINSYWKRSYLNQLGTNLPKKTFHNHIEAIGESLGVEIVCDRKTGYRYYIQEEEMHDKWMTNLLDTLSIHATVGEGMGMKDRIVDYDIKYESKLPMLAQIIGNRNVISFRVYIALDLIRQDPDMANTKDIDFSFSHFCPLGLVQAMNQWYVIGVFCEHGPRYGSVAAYRVEDVCDIKIMEGVFMQNYPEDFSVKDYIKNLTIKWERYFNQTMLLYSDLYNMGLKDEMLRGPQKH